MTIGINSFARRYVESSPDCSHFDGCLGDVALMAESQDMRPGAHPGTRIVDVNPKGFFSPVIPLTKDTVVIETCIARRKGEQPFRTFRAPKASKSPAKAVELILYERETLIADYERERIEALEQGKEPPIAEGFYNVDADDELELIMIKAKLTTGFEPMDIGVMVRNQLELTGGTTANYSSDLWHQAVKFGLTTVMCGGNEDGRPVKLRDSTIGVAIEALNLLLMVSRLEEISSEEWAQASYDFLTATV